MIELQSTIKERLRKIKIGKSKQSKPKKKKTDQKIVFENYEGVMCDGFWNEASEGESWCKWEKHGITC